MEWSNDSELFELLKKYLYTPVVGDIMDEMGYYHQFLPAAVHGMVPDMILAGRAMPVRIETVTPGRTKPFGLLTEALDQILPGEVYVGACENINCAAWGELLTATARVRGAVGAVINGYHRDTPQILKQNWPVFSIGGYAQDMSVRGAIIEYRCTVQIGEVIIRPGELVFADCDGVLIVPREIEGDVLTRAFEKARGEKDVRHAIEDGMSATEAFRVFGIL